MGERATCYRRAAKRVQDINIRLSKLMANIRGGTTKRSAVPKHASEIRSARRTLQTMLDELRRAHYNEWDAMQSRIDEYLANCEDLVSRVNGIPDTLEDRRDRVDDFGKCT